MKSNKICGGANLSGMLMEEEERGILENNDVKRSMVSKCLKEKDPQDR